MIVSLPRGRSEQMAVGLNKVLLIGHLGRDPEIRYTPNGLAIATFSLATSEAYTTKDGNRETRTEWHRIVAFGRLAEVCGEYLNKGSMVYVEGRLQTREWEDRDGNRRWTTEIVMTNMQMLDKKGAAVLPEDAALPPEADIPESGGAGQNSNNAAPDTSSKSPEDDDIPF